MILGFAQIIECDYCHLRIETSDLKKGNAISYLKKAKNGEAHEPYGHLHNRHPDDCLKKACMEGMIQ